MITIKPDYAKQPKCYYCNKNIASKDAEVEKEMYRVVKSSTIPLGYKYITAKVIIPRCKSCERRHRILWFIITPIFIGIAIFVGIYLHNADSDWFNGFWYSVFGVMVCGLVSSIVSGIILYLLSWIQGCLSKDIKPELDIDEYWPIKIMQANKWRQNKPDPSSKGGGDADSFSEKGMREMLDKIKEKTGCEIMNYK